MAGGETAAVIFAPVVVEYLKNFLIQEA